MREALKTIKELHELEYNVDNTIERAYEAGRVDGVLQYLEEKMKDNPDLLNNTKDKR